MKKVFISYSHDSPEHAARVLAFSNQLMESGGIDCILDQYNSNPPEGWPRWMDFNVREADFVLMVCTETYYRRVYLKEEPGKGFGVTWEGNLIYNHFYKGKTLDPRFIPVLFTDGSEDHIPTPFVGKTNYRIDDPRGYDLLYRELTGQPLNVKPTPKEGHTILPPNVPAAFAIQNPSPHPHQTSRLPDTSGHLFGRESQLKLLDEAWADPHTKIVCFVAQGGEGKTALLRRWVNVVERDGFRGAQCVYAWSFYSQGASQERQVSSSPFLIDALKEFGDPEIANSNASDADKARRLATLIRQHSTLLILDGVEPLQHPPGEPHDGRMRDEGIRALLKELGGSNKGLCIVSTRVHIRELDSFKGQGVIQEKLPRLNKEAGAALLKELGVKGRQNELEHAAEDFHGHALALTLLGNLLARYHKGDIRKRDLIPPLVKSGTWGGHAERVLAYYAQMFEGKPELGILRILGLFDRPAEPAAIQALREEAAIDGITDSLLDLNEWAWKDTLQCLRDLCILEEGDALDCHPLIREYFAAQLTQDHAAAWQEAHRRLYAHYKAQAKELPDTLQEMEPLYRAMGHGCKAGLYQEAFGEVLRKRIHRDDKFYSIFKLGAFSSDLAAIAGLFETPWRVVRGQLQEGSRTSLLSQVGFCLLALGRLQEAIEPIEASLEMGIEQEDWENAARSASYLSHLRLTRGQVTQAVTDGRNAVSYADQSEDLFQKLSARTTLANALHHAGQPMEAETLFTEAEEIQAQDQPDYPMLYSVQGYRFSDLLLDKGNWEELKERAMQTLEWAKVHGNLLSIALHQLSLGKVAHLQAISDGSNDYTPAKSSLNQAIEDLRKAGQIDFTPSGLLARATLHRDMQQYKAAQTDLTEALDIAESGEMRLFLTDYHLESARLCLAMGGKDSEARAHYAAAQQLVSETGYHRRDRELEELRGRLGV